jgi:hypothetical protein
MNFEADTGNHLQKRLPDCNPSLAQALLEITKLLKVGARSFVASPATWFSHWPALH